MTTIGERLRDLRRQRGWTQSQAVEGLSIGYSYLSLIESGQRQPSADVVAALAERYSTTAEFLTTGRGTEARTLQYDLRFAELALRSGDAATARERFAAVLDQATELGPLYGAERYEALYGLSQANEALGDLRAAINGFEALAATSALPSTVNRTTVTMWLCRAYMQCGDLARAIDLGERALTELDADRGVFVSEEATRLASTLVLGYVERGDLTRAQIIAESTVTGAEAGGSIRARAAAYWNAAVVAEARAEFRAAMRLMEAALALYGELGHARAVASLRANTGTLHLRLPNPNLTMAEAYLQQALEELATVASPADVATAEAELARCRLMKGDVVNAVDIARTAVERAGEGLHLEQARARAVLASALWAAGEEPDAVAAYTLAAASLEEVGARRQAAPVWRELAAMLVAMGRKDDAITALERVAAALGVPVPPALPATVRA